jgi:hypothetical protein
MGVVIAHGAYNSPIAKVMFDETNPYLHNVSCIQFVLALGLYLRSLIDLDPFYFFFKILAAPF